MLIPLAVTLVGQTGTPATPVRPTWSSAQQRYALGRLRQHLPLQGGDHALPPQQRRQLGNPKGGWRFPFRPCFRPARSSCQLHSNKLFNV